MPNNPENPEVSCDRCGRTAVALAYLHAVNELGRPWRSKRLGKVCQACVDSLARLTAREPTITLELAPLWAKDGAK